MNNLKQHLTATFLMAAMFITGAAQAMQIRQFDKMANPDQDDYVVELIQGAQQVLTDTGRSSDADKVRYLFTTNDAGDKISIGMTEFELNLARARVADAKRAEQDPNAQRLEVEDAMAVTLKKNGIELPQSFFTVMSNFRPKVPAAGEGMVADTHTPTPPQ